MMGSVHRRDTTSRGRESGSLHEVQRELRRKGIALSCVAVEQLQAFDAPGIKLVVNIFGQIRAHVRLADAEFRPPLPRYLREALREQPVIPRSLKNRR